jgi:hypothetical protein
MTLTKTPHSLGTVVRFCNPKWGRGQSANYVQNIRAGRVTAVQCILPAIAVVVFGVACFPQRRDHFSVVQGNIVRMQPYGALFRFPLEWVGNTQVTRTELRTVEKGDGEWDRQYATIVNAALPFEDCSVQAKGTESASRIQMRAYIMHRNIIDVEKRIRERGISAAKRLPTVPTDRFSAGKGLPSRVENVAARQDKVGEWDRILITSDLWFLDYGGTASVEFYVANHENWTAVLVFMYSQPTSAASGQRPPDVTRQSIQYILRSFSWP